MGLWTWRDIGPEQGWFGVPAGNFYAWLFVTLAFSLVSRWLREASRDRPMLEWLQLLVPVPAFAILLGGLVPFTILQPIVEPGPGAGLGIFAFFLAAFVAISGWAIWGSDRGRPDGAADAIVDLRFAFVSRLAIHLVFLVALLWLGLATSEPILLVVALILLAAELPMASLVTTRRRDIDEAHTD
jgi:hypothetical protein